MLQSEIVQRLRAYDVFAGVSTVELERLLASAEVRDVGAGARILEEGEPSSHLFALLEGVVGVFYSSPDAIDVLVKVFGAPSIFGEMELFFSLPRLEYVESFTCCTVVAFPAPVIMSFLQSDGCACFAMLKDVASRLCIAAYNERALAFQPVSVRLAGLLLSFVEACGVRERGRMVLELRLTHEMLARCLAVTTRSIERTMRLWRQAGWIERARGRLAILDLDQLVAEADPERLALFYRLGLSPRRPLVDPPRQPR